MSFELTRLTPLLQVFDMPSSIGFYRDLLGFEMVSTSPALGGHDEFNWVLLRRGEVDLMLNTAYEAHQRPATADPARTIAHGDTGLYLGCPDVDAVFCALRDAGLAVREPVIQPYGRKEFTLMDPDGYALCFQQQP